MNQFKCVALVFVMTAWALSGAAQDPEAGDVAEQQSVAPTPTAEVETACSDGADDDGDSMVDCADADCYKDPYCEAGGSPENNNTVCADWIDNDGDGNVDCDDSECQGRGVTVCEGSADRRNIRGGGGNQTEVSDDLPELEEGMTVDDLVGSFGDNDGERNDYMCSDGMDNDGDGRVDCADFGCRFDPQVSVCSADPEFRFSVVAGVGYALDISDTDNITQDVSFTRLQVRALGPIPLIDNSFFLLSARLERTPRLTFALFQIPIGDTGHYVNINSGGGSLSSGLIVSAGKRPLLDAPFYLFNAFEQGNGAAIEFSGPITSTKLLRYRLYAAGGSGVFNGNVGGRFFRDDDRNFNWSVGGQLGINIIGYYDRFDTRYLYTPVPTALAFQVGLKYDERSVERYPAANVLGIFQSGPFLAVGETYMKYVLDYDSFQIAWNAQVSALVVPKWFMLAADVGSYYATDFETVPVGGFSSNLPRPLDELQFRAAAHLYFFRNIGILSLLYSETHFEDDPDDADAPELEREIRLEAQYRF